MFRLACIFEAYNFNIFLTYWQAIEPNFIFILGLFPLCFVFMFFTLHNYNHMVATWCFVLILLILLNRNHSMVPIKWYFLCVFGVVNYPSLFWILFQFLWSIRLTCFNFHRLFIYIHLHPPKVYARFKNFHSCLTTLKNLLILDVNGVMCYFP